MPKSIKLERSLLEKVITELENSKTYANRSALYKDVVSKLVGEHNYSPFSVTTIYQRVEKDNTWTMVLKTPKGKRGGHLSGNPQALEEWKKTGESRHRKVDDCTKLLEMAKKEENGKFLKLAKSIKRGSLKAAIKFKCLDCSAFKTDDVKNCQVFSCPLWPVRPYRLVQISTKE